MKWFECYKCDKCHEEKSVHLWFPREKKALCKECSKWYRDSLSGFEDIFFEAFFNPSDIAIQALHKFQPERLNPENADNSVCDSLNSTNKERSRGVSEEGFPPVGEN